MAPAVSLTRAGRLLDRVTLWKPMNTLCEQANVVREKVFSHNLRQRFARTFYGIAQNIIGLADRPSGRFRAFSLCNLSNQRENA